MRTRSFQPCQIAFARSYIQIISEVTVQAEREMLGMDHAEIGAKLAEEWNMPAEITAAIRYHHEPDKASDFNHIVDTVHVADIIALMLGFGLGADGLRYNAKQEILGHLGIKQSEFDKLCADIMLEYSQVEKIFEIS